MLIIQQLVNGITFGAIIAVAALGLTLVFGVLRIPNFVHGQTLTIGGFFTLYLVTRHGLNFFLALIVAAVPVAAIGMLIERITFRPLIGRNQEAQFVAALAMFTIIEAIIELRVKDRSELIRTSYGGDATRIGDIVIGNSRLVAAGVAVAAIVAAQLVLHRTKVGRAMRAVADDSVAAALVGVDQVRIRLATFAVGSALGAVAGGLLGSISAVNAHMALSPTLLAFIVIVLGGLGSVGGTIIGAFILSCMTSIATIYVPGYQQSAAFLLLIVLLVVRPQGLFGKAGIGH